MMHFRGRSLRDPLVSAWHNSDRMREQCRTAEGGTA